MPRGSSDQSRGRTARSSTRSLHPYSRIKTFLREHRQKLSRPPRCPSFFRCAPCRAESFVWSHFMREVYSAIAHSWKMSIKGIRSCLPSAQTQRPTSPSPLRQSCQLPFRCTLGTLYLVFAIGSLFAPSFLVILCLPRLVVDNWISTANVLYTAFHSLI